MKGCEMFAIIWGVAFLSTASGSKCVKLPWRIPDKSPCPEGLRDDGTSCWSDAHIYGKGCCCTVFSKGCCNNCKAGYNDDGCTCRKTDVGIKVTLAQRWKCNADEELISGFCFPIC